MKYLGCGRSFNNQVRLILRYPNTHNGSLIAAGSGDEDVYIFDRSGTLLLREHVGVKLQSVQFSADGALLVAGSCAGTIKAIEISSR